MKKSLLQPPKEDSRILFLPGRSEFLSGFNSQKVIATAHQPYFFNPGVSLKFLFLDFLSCENKKLLFVDTDKVKIIAKVPTGQNTVYPEGFIVSNEILFDFIQPKQEKILDFFTSLGERIRDASLAGREGIYNNFLRFKDIFLRKKPKYLKNTLAESFLEYYGIERDYCFVSDVVDSKEFLDFFKRIHKDDNSFREVFNTALDDYKKEYRFRFKNFPFPKLEEGELPFWVVDSGKRERCFKKDVDLSKLENIKIFPRALTLTIFLRLYFCDIFIHGIGGANYEWVSNKVIERFFGLRPPPYAVISGTYLLEGFDQRESPYFFYSPEDIRISVDDFCRQNLFC